MRGSSASTENSGCGGGGRRLCSGSGDILLGGLRWKRLHLGRHGGVVVVVGDSFIGGGVVGVVVDALFVGGNFLV